VTNQLKAVFLLGALSAVLVAIGGSLGPGALYVFAPIAATLIQLGVSRSREYLADETAARLTGDPMALAQALAKLQVGAERIPAQAAAATASLFIVSRPFVGGRGLSSLFSTHPSTEERIRRLEAMARRRELVLA
jgi:heat shock protein HtpX